MSEYLISALQRTLKANQIGKSLPIEPWQRAYARIGRWNEGMLNWRKLDKNGYRY